MACEGLSKKAMIFLAIAHPVIIYLKNRSSRPWQLRFAVIEIPRAADRSPLGSMHLSTVESYFR